MKAYTVGITKDSFVAEMKQHQALDHFLKGTYSKGDKGCAVGCALKSIYRLKGAAEACSDHEALSKHLGIPEWIARVEDTIFEGLPLEKSKVWPVEFSEAINTGADLEGVRVPFILFILNENIKIQRKLLRTVEDVEVIKVIENVIEITKQMIAAHETGNKEEMQKAEGAAWAAESAALSTARSAAAWSAESAARSAALSTAWSAWSSAESTAQSAVRSAADSAEWAARSAVASAARSAPWAAAYEKFAEELLQLIRECK